MTTSAILDQAERLIRHSGSRATPARIRVLAYLLSEQNAVAHHEIEAALGDGEKIDRVTLYRVLDWMIEQGLVHRVAGIDRAWRFRINVGEIEHHQHAHFKCKRCAKVICLGDASVEGKIPALPEGYKGLEVELTIKGLCAKCA